MLPRRRANLPCVTSPSEPDEVTEYFAFPNDGGAITKMALKVAQSGSVSIVAAPPRSDVGPNKHDIETVMVQVDPSFLRDPERRDPTAVTVLRTTPLPHAEASGTYTFVDPQRPSGIVERAPEPESEPATPRTGNTQIFCRVDPEVTQRNAVPPPALSTEEAQPHTQRLLAPAPPMITEPEDNRTRVLPVATPAPPVAPQPRARTTTSGSTPIPFVRLAVQSAPRPRAHRIALALVCVLAIAAVVGVGLRARSARPLATPAAAAEPPPEAPAEPAPAVAPAPSLPAPPAAASHPHRRRPVSRPSGPAIPAGREL